MTLAIVIGVIMIAGATLLYNQAKVSAGNSRAQAKVASLQALVEETMSRNDGTVPEIDALRALWLRRRPDDWQNSPWGGRNGPVEFPSGTETAGIVHGSDIPADAAEMGAGGNHLIGGKGGGGGAARKAPADGWTGILLFYWLPDAEKYQVWDEGRRSFVAARHYAVATTNSLGERWFHVGSLGGSRTAGAGTAAEGSVSDKD